MERYENNGTLVIDKENVQVEWITEQPNRDTWAGEPTDDKLDVRGKD